MNKNIKLIILFLGAAIMVLCLWQVFAAKNIQDGETLILNKETSFVLKNKEDRTFYLDLKKGDFTEIFYEDSLKRFPDFILYTPSGERLSREVYVNQTMPFVAPENGRYRLIIKFDEFEPSETEAKITIRYSNVFNFPKSAKLVRQRKMAGYEIKVFNSTAEDGEYGSYLLIEKNGKLRHFLKGGSLVGGGFNFADDATLFDYPEGKRSARLFRTMPDKTGEGTPDIAVQFYTGGAHCCFDMHLFELGEEVKKVPLIDGRDSDIIATGKKPGGSLIIKTGDSTFAYWLTSFAGSPIPTVILSYKNGEFRPDPALMRKPAPTLAVLKRKAAAAKKHMNSEAYNGEDSESDSLTDAFWGEMLDLLYAGNESAAWQYFDLVWDARKPGKEKFKQDFLRRLNASEYWRMLSEDRK